MVKKAVQPIARRPQSPIQVHGCLSPLARGRADTAFAYEVDVKAIGDARSTSSSMSSMFSRRRTLLVFRSSRSSWC